MSKESIIDMRVLSQITGGDPAVERAAIEEFLRFSRGDAELLGRAVRERDTELLCHAAHRMKGASLTLGAMALGEACDMVERAARSRRVAGIDRLAQRVEAELRRLELHMQGTRAKGQAETR